MRALMIVLMALALFGCREDTTDGDGDGDANQDCDEPDAEHCPENTEWCAEACGCINTIVTFEHCGECGHSCEGCERCIMGVCTPQCCDDLMDCDPSPDTILCIDLDSDPEYCGQCDSPCDPGEICESGDCVPE